MGYTDKDGNYIDNNGRVWTGKSPGTTTTGTVGQMGPSAPYMPQPSSTGSGFMQQNPGPTNPFGGNSTSPTFPNPFGGDHASTFPNPFGGDNAYGGGGGMSAFEKWKLGLGIVGGALGAYNQYQQGKDAKAQSQAQLEQQKTQFNQGSAPDIARQLEQAPLRDRANFLMQARMGINPQQFKGDTLTTTGQMGGPPPQQMADANNAYRPGAGGTGPTSDLYKKMLQDMGYPYGGG